MIAYNKQAGAVLVVSLVLLTVMTLIGVASMSSSSLEMRVASNSQQHNIAFQAAESRIDFIVSRDPTSPVNFKIPIPTADDHTTWPAYDQDCDLNSVPACANGAGWESEAVASYAGCALGEGSSLEEGKAFSLRFFDVRTIGQVGGSNSAYSTQVQGVAVPVAGC